MKLIFNPLPIPETQDRIKIAVTITAIIIHTIGFCGIPKTASNPAPICMRPTLIEFDVAHIRQKITSAVITVLSHGIFSFVALSTIDDIDRLFPVL